MSSENPHFDYSSKLGSHLKFNLIYPIYQEHYLHSDLFDISASKKRKDEKRLEQQSKDQSSKGFNIDERRGIKKK